MCDNPLTRDSFDDAIARAIVDEAEPSLSFVAVLRAVVMGYNLIESRIDNHYRPLVMLGRQNPALAAELIALCGPMTTREDAVVVGLMAGGILHRESARVFTLPELSGEPCLVQLADLVAIRTAYDGEPLKRTLEIIRLAASVDLECEHIANHLVHLALDHYSADPDGWFCLLTTTLENGPEHAVQTCFDRLAREGHLLESAHLFGLIHRHQSGCSILDDMSTVLLSYAEHTTEVMDIVFGWIASGRIFQVQLFDDFLFTLASANPVLIDEYVRRYIAWHPEHKSREDPLEFAPLAKASPQIALSAIVSISPIDSETPRGRENFRTVIDLAWILVKACAADLSFTAVMQSLYCFLEGIGTCTALSGKNRSVMLSGRLTKAEYDRLVDMIATMLERLKHGPVRVDRHAIGALLSRCPTLSTLVPPLLAKVKQEGSCHPFVDLLASATPPDENPNGPYGCAEASAMLRVLEKGSQLYLSRQNDKFTTTLRKERHLEKEFSNPDRFNSLLSEYLLICRLDPILKGCDRVFDKRKGTDLDIEIAVEGAQIFIEIIAPQEPRYARFTNGGSVLESRVAYAITQKHEDMIQSGADSHLRPGTDIYYLIAIETSNLPLVELDAAEGIHGPLVLSSEVGPGGNPENNRIYYDSDESVLKKLQKAPLISGVILYSLDFDWDEGGCEAKIKGDLVPNRWTTNPLPEPQCAALGQILFGSHSVDKDLPIV